MKKMILFLFLLLPSMATASQLTPGHSYVWRGIEYLVPPDGNECEYYTEGAYIFTKAELIANGGSALCSDYFEVSTNGIDIDRSGYLRQYQGGYDDDPDCVYTALAICKINQYSAADKLASSAGGLLAGLVSGLLFGLAIILNS